MGIIARSNFFWAPSQNFAYKNISRPDPKVKILQEIPGELSNICEVQSDLVFKLEAKNNNNNNLNTL